MDTKTTVIAAISIEFGVRNPAPSLKGGVESQSCMALRENKAVAIRIADAFYAHYAAIKDRDQIDYGKRGPYVTDVGSPRLLQDDAPKSARQRCHCFEICLNQCALPDTVR